VGVQMVTVAWVSALLILNLVFVVWRVSEIANGLWVVYGHRLVTQVN
jgi:uncharacterized membrane protein YcjF (UPF0283 family)